MILHRSNRAEELVRSLASVVSRGLHPDARGPLRPECIVVQGRGMERWLSMELARHLGVWANPDFPFPRRLIERALDAVLEPSPADALDFDPEKAIWSLTALLPTLIEREPFRAVRHFLSGEEVAGDEHGIRLVQLAQRIAETFDHYLTYRPEMMLGWERGESAGREVPVDGDAWQPLLWRELARRQPGTHLAGRARAFCERLGLERERQDVARALATAAFPERVCFFGITALPPLYLDVLAALAGHVEVHLFELSCSRPPSRRVGAEPSTPSASRTLAASGAPAEPDSDVRPAGARGESNPLLSNPLLQSLGVVGREFQELLDARLRCTEPEEDLFRDSGSDDMLHAVQSDLLHARPPGALRLLAAADRSIAVHVCHGPMREVEVLHDQLLELFEADPTLAPQDVIVMTPDIEAYGPFVEAVFDAAASPAGAALPSSGTGSARAPSQAAARAGRRNRPPIRYRIADRSVRTTHDVIDALTSLLDALSGRMTASEVLDLLMLDRIRARFGIPGEELEELRAWIQESGIRWGVDAAHRGSFAQPELEQNTWRLGLDRLLLGHALRGDGQTLYRGVLPSGDVEARRTDLLGRFVEFCETLFRFRSRLEAPRTLECWRDDLVELLEAMVERDEGSQQHAMVRRSLDELASCAEAVGFEEPVALESLRVQLERSLQRAVPVRGFLSGGVTFCEMVPMRSIPFRVIALLGMNDDAFPRSREPLAFDLVAREPRPGDRSARDDDRYLFLEALLSARERLLITYVGFSIRDGSRRPPSVVVSELLDQLVESFQTVSAELPDRVNAVLGQVVSEHPLHSFSPRYFGAGSDERLFSYSASACEGARALLHSQAAPPSGRSFVPHPLPSSPASAFEAGDLAVQPSEPGRPEPEELEIADLGRFFEHPVRFFLQRQLGLYLASEAPALEDREPTELDALDEWQVADALMRFELSGVDAERARQLVRATGVLPPGQPGELVAEKLARRVESFARRVRELQRGEALESLRVDRVLGRGGPRAVRLTGVICDLWPHARVVHRLSRVPHPHELNFWLQHLVLCWLQAPGVPMQSCFVARPERGEGVVVVKLPPVADAASTLEDLVDLYRIGQRAPLPLFPRTSRIHADESLREGWAEVSAKAERAWRGGGGIGPGPENVDPYLLQVFREIDPLAADSELAGGLEFAELARRVYEPFLTLREELREELPGEPQ